MGFFVDSRFRLPWAIIILVLVGTVSSAGPHSAAPRTPATPLPTLRTAREAHNLTLEQARRGYPIRLRAVATTYNPYIDPRRAALFLQDRTGPIFAAVTPLPSGLRPGTPIEVTGVSAPGDFAPIIDHATVRVINPHPVRLHPASVSLGQLLTGKYDAAWVEVEGVIRSVSIFGNNVNLELALRDGNIRADSVLEPSVDYSKLIDAKVKIQASAGALFNRNRQMTGARLLFPGIEQITVEEPAQDPSALPVLPIGALMRYTADLTFRHRVRVQGRVSLFWPGRILCVQDDRRGLCVQTAQTSPLAAGDLVDLVGFPTFNGLTPTLANTTFRAVGHVGPVRPSTIRAEQAIRGERDGELVQIEGKVIGKDRSAKDPTMVLSSGNFLFPVILPRPLLRSLNADPSTPEWEDGSLLRVTGICSVQVDGNEWIRDGHSVPSSFRILLRSPQDVLVLRKPSWWTPTHLLPVLVSVLLVALCVLGWIALLRQRIAEQSALIQKQNETLIGLSFQDALTGIPNRRKFDETLESAFQGNAALLTPLSLLMIDIDHFKALNDEYGHQMGDECLVQVARVLASVSLRDGDLVARYGGEEFAVLLSGCDGPGALAVAERMRTAVLDLAIPHVASPFDGWVSISVGAATLVPGFNASARALIAGADRALYRSKLTGRNRTTLAGDLDFQNVAVLADHL